MARPSSATTTPLRCSISSEVTAATRAILCAFDLLEVNGEDIRREPIEDRKGRLAGLLRLPHQGIALNEHYREEGSLKGRKRGSLGTVLHARGSSAACQSGIVTGLRKLVSANFCAVMGFANRKPWTISKSISRTAKKSARVSMPWATVRQPKPSAISRICRHAVRFGRRSGLGHESLWPDAKPPRI
jgi:hypothetical protein